MTETWKPIAGYEGSYEVSDHGRVRSLDRIVTGANGIPMRISGRIRRPGTHIRSGHKQIILRANGELFGRFVHRLVLEAFVGPCPEGMECCHNDGNPANNRLENLRWGTRSENVQDMLMHGTHAATKKTHCPQGHPLKRPNLIPSQEKRGHRQCLACDRARGRARKNPSLKPIFKKISDECYAAIIDSHKEPQNG